MGGLRLINKPAHLSEIIQLVAIEKSIARLTSALSNHPFTLKPFSLMFDDEELYLDILARIPENFSSGEIGKVVDDMNDEELNEMDNEEIAKLKKAPVDPDWKVMFKFWFDENYIKEDFQKNYTIRKEYENDPALQGKKPPKYFNKN